MPFDFGGFADFADFGSFADFGAEAFSAIDVSSVIDVSGAEFLTSIGIDPASVSSFADAPISDLANIDAWAQVGDFAGDPNWFDAFYSGDIVDSAGSVASGGFGFPDVLEEGLGGITNAASAIEDPFEALRVAAEENFALVAGPTELDVIKQLPFTEQVKAIANQVSQDFTGFVKDVQTALPQIQKYLPIVNAVSSALGIQAPVGQVLQGVQQAVGIAGAAAGVAGAAATGNVRAAATNPAVVGAVYALAGSTSPQLAQGIGVGISTYNTAQRIGATLPPVGNATPVSGSTGYTTVGGEFGTGPIVTSAGVPADAPFRELSLEETQQLTRNATLINSFVDPGVQTSANYNTAIETRAQLTPALELYQNELLSQELEIKNNSDTLASLEAQLTNPELTEEERQDLEFQIIGVRDNIARLEDSANETRSLIGTTTTQLLDAQQIITATNDSAIAAPGPTNVARTTPRFIEFYDPETGTWSIFNNDTGATVQTGLTERQAIATAAQLEIDRGISLTATAAPVNLGTLVSTVLPSLTTNPGDTEGSSARNLVAEARAQQSVRSIRNNQAQSSDWRVRLRLAPNSTYLYNAPGNPGDPASGPGIMAPLRKTDGVIFPYTPAIDTAYKANYEAYDLTHANYRGYFYKGSYVDAINVRAQFTAQDTNEADYLLAVIHFFRSATKMFYGKDQVPGAPPPLVYLSGYGDFQFNEHPCVISQFNYQLPPDVDYIRAQNALNANTSMLGNRIRNPIANNPLSYTVNRLLNSNLLPGALDFRPNIASNLPVGSPTYVPTKMEISITLLPIQSRQSVSKNFSVKSFASGNLLKGGYW